MCVSWNWTGRPLPGVVHVHSVLPGFVLDHHFLHQILHLHIEQRSRENQAREGRRRVKISPLPIQHPATSTCT